MAIERAYRTSSDTVVDICKAFAITRTRLYARARREGWPARRRSRGQVVAKGGSQGAGTGSDADDRPSGSSRSLGTTRRTRRSRSDPGGDDGLARREKLIARLYEATERKLAMMEQRLVTGDDTSAVESEREARELGALIRSFEKLTAFDDQARQAAKEQRRHADERSAAGRGDAERWREEIARRIARLRTDRPTRGVSPDAD